MTKKRGNAFRLLWCNGHWWKTLVVLLVALGMARLGIWQLDRRQQRLARNEAVLTQRARPPLVLNDINNDADLNDFPYRLFMAKGDFDFEHQFLLKNQAWEGAVGYHLITPLRLTGRDVALLVDRGWIPFSAAQGDASALFAEPAGEVTVQGVLGREALPPSKLSGSFLPNPVDRTLYYVDPASLEKVLPYPLLSLYLVWTIPEEEIRTQSLPYRPSAALDLSEGPHLGYAIQWFSFTLIAVVGYGAWLLRQGCAQEEERG